MSTRYSQIRPNIYKNENAIYLPTLNLLALYTLLSI